jgi:hypothetical protein
MTKDEFKLRQDMVKRQCQSLGTRILGCIYVAMYPAIVILAVLLCMLWSTDARMTVVYMIGSCVFVLLFILVIYQRWTNKLKNLGLYCPSCHKWLELSVTETGRCNQCGHRVDFDG